MSNEASRNLGRAPLVDGAAAARVDETHKLAGGRDLVLERFEVPLTTACMRVLPTMNRRSRNLIGWEAVPHGVVPALCRDTGAADVECAALDPGT